jgi:hypothetical protein
MHFTFQTVDDPNSNVNEVTGINDVSGIVGAIGSGAISSPFAGYTSSLPYSSFLSQVFPKAVGTVATSLSATTVAGYVINPQQLAGTWAFVQIAGLWTIFKNHKEGTGKNAVTEILGVNDSGLAVGFFKNGSGVSIPVEIIIAFEQFANLSPPGGKSAQATGINDLGDVSGWEGTSNRSVGFLMRVGTYYTFLYPNASTTEAFGLNGQDQIVGYYRDSSGMRHGFILTNPTKGGSQQVWQPIDEPNGKRGTVVTGINDDDHICGYYVDANGVQHGFVAIPS